MKYSSKRFDEESGLYYFGRRYYQPDIGRWITPDPAGFTDGFNLYNSVNNNPLRYIDPDGRLPFLIVPITLYALEFSLPYLVPLVTEYTGSALAGSLLAAAVHGLNGTGSIDPTVLLSGDIPAIVHQGCLVSSLVGSSVKTITKSGMNYARNQLIGSVVDKSTKKAFNWCSQKLTRQTINKVSKDTNKVAERILVTNNFSKKIDAVDSVIKETLQSKGMITSRYKLSADEALRAEEKFLGPSYKEIGQPGRGIFRSEDGLRQFRIDCGSITGKHAPNSPHVHLEAFKINEKAPYINNHILFYE